MGVVCFTLLNLSFSLSIFNKNLFKFGTFVAWFIYTYLSGILITEYDLKAGDKKNVFYPQSLTLTVWHALPSMMHSGMK